MPPAFEWQVLHWLESAPFVVIVFIASHQIIVSNTPRKQQNPSLVS